MTFEDQWRSRPRRTAASLLAADGPLAAFVAGRTVRDVEADQAPADRGDADVVLAYRRLQDIADYRAALQGWFGALGVGGHLIVIVPHAFLYERQMMLPSPWRPEQRRLYTPASLLQEVEEALAPNSYRVRLLADLDEGYDYELPVGVEPEGASDLAVVLERIAAPPLRAEPSSRPLRLLAPQREPFAFEPVRTRIELNAHLPARKILILKLDHLGDLIMALPALTKARSYFADAEITLAVGAWNAGMAKELAVADKIIAFNAFPRNSTEERPNVEATLGHFRALVTDHYDLAIDLRTDIDTRTLLDAVDADVKAGIGTRRRFPFLDIALPLDSTRNEAERAQQTEVHHGAFIAQGSARRRHFGVHSDRDTVEHDCAIVWGPYAELTQGDYVFDFFIDLEQQHGAGLLRLDIALDRGERIAEMFVSGPGTYQLPFRIEKPRAVFEARIWTVPGHPSISFGFYGGLIIRRGAESVLHQSEYSSLLIELVKLRMRDFGVLRERASP